MKNYIGIGIFVVLIAALIILSPKVEKQELAVEDASQRVQEKAAKYSEAIELVSPEGYINTDKITVAEHIGKNIVLIDFWTYSCINCIRTLPYLNAWDEKYRDSGLVIIGVHTPEFDFEKDYENVQSAVNEHNIKYPVVQDNDYQTWRAYQNRYWPRKYLIDIDGYIVYDHIGEGAYEQTERKIQELLEERAAVLGEDMDFSGGLVKPEADRPSGFSRTPEIYFGYGFSRGQIGNSEGWHPDEDITYNLPKDRQDDRFYLEGEWHNSNDYMELNGDGVIEIVYSAKAINMVAGSEEPVDIAVYQDRAYLHNITVDGYNLYELVDNQGYSKYDLRLESDDGLRAYTFTFG